MTRSGIEALERLKEGNLRYSNPGTGEESFEDRVGSFSDLSAGQSPFAAVLACSDSRVPVESIFWQGAGSLFVVRVAGNVVGPHQLGSLEFAVDALGVPLILVMGHTGCGAVKAAMAAASAGAPAEGGQVGSLPALLEPILDGLGRLSGSRLQDGSLEPDEAVRLNVRAACEALVGQSDLVGSRVESGGLLVVGAIYDLSTGRVEFLG